MTGGSPKYFPSLCTMDEPRHLEICEAIIGEVRLQIITSDLSLFMVCPDAAWKDCRHYKIVLVDWRFASAKTRQSSVKRRWDIDGLLRWICIPFKSLCWIASLRLADELSMVMMNKYGDKGSPWRRPHDGLNYWLRAPLSSTRNDVEVMQDSI